jgi:ketosteroid isomerase-like protein
MTQENVEIVRRAYEALTVREHSRIPEFFAPEIEIDLTRNVFNPAIVRGYEGLERFVATVNDVWDDFRFEVEELIDSGEQVVAVVRLLGKGKGSGAPVDQQDIHVWTMRDGRCWRAAVYRDRAEALEAAGLSEKDARGGP